MKQLTLSFFLLILGLTASAQDFIINDFKADLQINEDGSINVEEDITVFFEKKKRGIYRSIPTKYNKDGKSLRLGIKNISVQGHEFKTSKKSGDIEIRIGNKDVYIKGEQTYQIKYTIQNGIQSYSDYQELYYDLTGDKWKAEIQEMSFAISLPKSININASELRITTGKDGEVIAGASIKQVNSKSIKGQVNRLLKKREGVTVAIKLPKTYLSVADLASNQYVPTKSEIRNDTPQNPWLAIIPVGLLGLFLSFWNKLKGKNRIDEEPVYQFYPPEGITSAHVGAYIDQQAHSRDVVSLIPYWAAEGYLTLKKEENETFLIKNKALASEFPDYEHTVFNHLFKDDNIASMSDLNEKFYTTLAKAKTELTKEVMSQGYYDENYQYWFRSWRLILFPILLAVIAAFSFGVLHQAILGIVCLVFMVISLLLGVGKLPLSTYGAKMKHGLDGLKMFLSDMPQSDIDRLVNEDPKYFEKMLPFAVAFGIEKTFIPKFESKMDYMPHWYVNTSGNQSFTSFQSDFQVETITSAFSSFPASANGGGSSGGGFSSGGGVGGGGGGSW